MSGSTTVTGAIGEQWFVEPASGSARLERLGSPCLPLARRRKDMLAKSGADSGLPKGAHPCAAAGVLG